MTARKPKHSETTSESDYHTKVKAWREYLDQEPDLNDHNVTFYDTEKTHAILGWVLLGVILFWGLSCASIGYWLNS